jgi:hypothetical protein
MSSLMLPAAQLRHRIPGRVRIKIQAKRGDVAYFTQVRERLSGFAGIHSLETNPITGSLLIQHAVDLESVARFAEEQDLFRLTTFYPPATVPIKYWINNNLRELDRGLRYLSGEVIDLASLIFLALFGLAIQQALEGNVMAPAITLFWYALTLLPVLIAKE